MPVRAHWVSVWICLKKKKKKNGWTLVWKGLSQKMESFYISLYYFLSNRWHLFMSSNPKKSPSLSKIWISFRVYIVKEGQFDSFRKTWRRRNSREWATLASFPQHKQKHSLDQESFWNPEVHFLLSFAPLEASNYHSVLLDTYVPIITKFLYSKTEDPNPQALNRYWSVAC